MADRSDPLGSWFDADAMPDQLPRTAHDSRVMQPRSAESAGMQPRAGTLVTKKVSAGAFIPMVSLVSGTAMQWSMDGGRLIFPNNGAFSAIMSVSMDEVPTGAKLVDISLTSYRKDTTSSVNMQFIQSFPGIPPAAIATNLVTIVSTANANWQTDVATLNDLVVDQINNSYFARIFIGSPVAYNSGDVAVLWLQLRYIVPG